MRINKDLSAAVAAVYDDAVTRGSLDTKVLEDQVVALMDKVIELDEPWDSMSDFLIRKLVQRLITKLSDPEFRAKLLEEASERSEGFRERMVEKMQALRK